MTAPLLLAPVIYNFVYSQDNHRFSKPVGGEDPLHVALANAMMEDPGYVQILLEMLHKAGVFRVQEFTVVVISPLTDDASPEAGDFWVDENARLLRRISTLEAANQELQDELKLAQHLASEAEQRASRAEDVAGELKRLEAEVDDLLLMIEAKEQEYTGLLQIADQEQTAVRAKLTTAEQELEAARRDVGRASNLVSEKHATIGELNSKNSQLQTQVTALTQAERLLRLALQEAQTTLNDIQGGKLLKRGTAKRCGHFVVIIVDKDHDAAGDNKCCWIDYDEAPTPHPRPRVRKVR